jgi:hypothetical protein
MNANDDGLYSELNKQNRCYTDLLYTLFFVATFLFMFHSVFSTPICSRVVHQQKKSTYNKATTGSDTSVAPASPSQSSSLQPSLSLAAHKTASR